MAIATLVAAVAFALLLPVAVVYFAAAGCPWPALCGPVVDDTIEQGRLNLALPAPVGDFVIEQTFTPAANGLSEIELLLVRYDNPAGQPGGDQPAALTLRLLDDAGALVATDSLRADRTTHNQSYLLRFPPQSGSAGRVYTLTLSGEPGNQLSTWAYSLDVHDGGELRLIGPGPTTDARELRFVARTTLVAAEGARAAAGLLVGGGRLFGLVLLFLLMPGYLLLSGVGRGWDAAARLGAALALGVAVWPVVWYWVSLAGGRWSGPLLWAVVVVGWAVVALLAVRRSRRLPGRGRVSHARLWPGAAAHGLLLLLLLVGLAVRLLAVRDLAFPPWVDSSRHGLITAVIVEQGRTPQDYAPLLPVDRFPYHYGFHTIAASLMLMDEQPLPRLLLMLGQLLNALVPLTVYAAGWMVTRRRAVGLAAAFLVALPFFFPAYYATWGRMTQLAAMLVMPVLIALSWRLGRGWSRLWPLVGLLAAGLFLLHFRVFLFYVPYAALTLALHLARRRPWPLLKAGGLGLGLVLPRARELLSVTNPAAALGAAIPGYNEFPTGYYDAGWEQYFIWAAAAGLVVALGAALLRRRWALYPLLLAAWVGALFALLAGERLGLPESWLVNLNSMYITLFVPLALFLAIVGLRVWDEGLRLLGRLPERATGLAGGVAGLLVAMLAAALALFGARQQIDILNHQTLLAGPTDRTTLAWIDDNLPDDALVAVSSWLWLGSTWAAADGGAWLTPLTGRQATTPPVDYIYDGALERRVATFNETASAIEDWSTPDAAAFLREQGVSHVLVGRRGGFLDPAELIRNEALALLYQSDGTFVFAVAAAGPE